MTIICDFCGKQHQKLSEDGQIQIPICGVCMRTLSQGEEWDEKPLLPDKQGDNNCHRCGTELSYSNIFYRKRKRYLCAFCKNLQKFACPNCKKEKRLVPSDEHECPDCGCRFSVSEEGIVIPLEKDPEWFVPSLILAVVPIVILYVSDWLWIEFDPELGETVSDVVCLVCSGSETMILFLYTLKTGRTPQICSDPQIYKHKRPSSFFFYLCFFLIMTILTSGACVYFVWRYYN